MDTDPTALLLPHNKNIKIKKNTYVLDAKVVTHVLNEGRQVATDDVT